LRAPGHGFDAGAGRPRCSGMGEKVGVAVVAGGEADKVTQEDPGGKAGLPEDII